MSALPASVRAMSKRSRTNQARAKQRERQAARRQARAAYVASQRPGTDARFWGHGGVAGLTPGTILVGRTQAESLGRDVRNYGLDGTYEVGVTNPERVYFSVSREFARAYAALGRVSDPETGVHRGHPPVAAAWPRLSITHHRRATAAYYSVVCRRALFPEGRAVLRTGRVHRATPWRATGHAACRGTICCRCGRGPFMVLSPKS